MWPNGIEQQIAELEQHAFFINKEIGRLEACLRGQRSELHKAECEIARLKRELMAQPTETER